MTHEEAKQHPESNIQRRVGELVMPALTVRQPWAWMIVHAGKDIENRTWTTHIRGRVLIHAAKGMTLGEYNDAWWWAKAKCGVEPPHQDTLQRGGIVGSVEIVDCVSRSDSQWFMGPHGFVLRDPRPLPFVPCRGALGFWQHTQRPVENNQR